MESAQASFGRSKAADNAPAAETRTEREAAIPSRKGRMLAVFRNELQYALMSRFRAKFTATQAGYAGTQAPPGSDDVAREALGAARQVAAETPTDVAKSLVSFRAQVRETAQYTRETVGNAGDAAEVDDAVARVEKGLQEIEQKSAEQRESSASVLAVDTRSKQRSSIRIRTQEGDVVRFDLKRVDRMSASDQAVSDSEGFMSVTEVEASTKTRLLMRVKGDLNNEEFAAIQNVFAQAESMANEFFGGDLKAAFSMAQQFDFDADQLARVNMRFRSSQVSNIAYSETVFRPGPQIEALPVAEIADRPAAAAAPPNPPQAEAVPQVAVEPVKVDDTEAVANDDVAQVTPEPAQQAVAAQSDDAVSDFLGALSDFLRSLGEGFESGSVRYQYSESFKLTLLNAALHTSESEALAREKLQAVDGASAED